MNNFWTSNFGLALLVLLGKRGRRYARFICSPIAFSKYIYKTRLLQYRRYVLQVRMARECGIHTPGLTRRFTTEDINEALAKRAL